MYQKTLRQLSQALSKKEISSEELTQHYLARIKKFNPELNAVITLCEESSLQQARAADKKITQGSFNHLCGIPLLHKDIFVPIISEPLAGQKC